MHLGGATGLQANFGRKLRAHKVTSEGLDDYVTVVVTNYLADREPERVVRDLGGAAPTRSCCAARRRLGRGARMSERAFPFHCPYCGERTCGRTTTRRRTARGNAAAACAPSP